MKIILLIVSVFNINALQIKDMKNEKTDRKCFIDKRACSVIVFGFCVVGFVWFYVFQENNADAKIYYYIGSSNLYDNEIQILIIPNNTKKIIAPRSLFLNGSPSQIFDDIYRYIKTQRSMQQSRSLMKDFDNIIFFYKQAENEKNTAMPKISIYQFASLLYIFLEKANIMNILTQNQEKDLKLFHYIYRYGICLTREAMREKIYSSADDILKEFFNISMINRLKCCME